MRQTSLHMFRLFGLVSVGLLVLAVAALTAGASLLALLGG